MSQQPTPAATVRGRQARPTAADQRRWWCELRHRADAGDVAALEAVLRLTTQQAEASR